MTGGLACCSLRGKAKLDMTGLTEEQQRQQAMPASLCLTKSFCVHTQKVVCDPGLYLFIPPDEGLDDTGQTLI